jgi:hypothetical protein
MKRAMAAPTVDAGYRIVSDEAAVISGHVTCWNCQTQVPVICMYCQTGFVDGEPMLDFSVSNVTRIDEALRVQLGCWPRYHPVLDRGSASDAFANHCPSCGKAQDDFYLHCQPGSLFFSFQAPIAQELRIHVLRGRIRLSGDEGFEPG